jgi:WD40 repeat protein/serine/threonine protein kinase
MTLSERLSLLLQPHQDAFDSITDRFDERWREDPENPPAIEAYLPDAEPLRRAVLIGLVLTDLRKRLRRGELVAVRHYFDRFPELRGDIAAQIDILESWQEAHGPRAGRIDDYEVGKELGRGGFGIVFKAKDKALNRTVALKKLYPHLFREEETRLRFLHEAQTWALLESYPNVVSIYGLVRQEDAWYIVSEFCDGPTLKEWLKGQGGRLVPHAAASLVATLAVAVQHIHDQGLVHRDLKPGNILFHGRDPEGRWPGNPKIADFGLAKRLAWSLEPEYPETEAGTRIGTPPYMSPEQFDPELGSIGPATDVWALGVILYELLIGVQPFVGPKEAIERQILHKEPPPPTRVNKAIPGDLEAVCLKCLQKELSAPVSTARNRKALRGERTKRYATATELADDLGRYLRGEPIKAQPPGVLDRTVKWVRRNRAITMVLVALIIVSAALAVAIIINNELKEARGRVERANEQLEQANKRQAFLTYARQINLADTYLKAAEYGAAHRHLSACPENFRDWEWHYLHRACPVRQDLRGDTGFVWDVVFSADGRSLISVESDSVVRYRDRMTGRTKGLVRLQGIDFTVGSMTLGSDGRLVGAAGLRAPRNGDPWAVARIWDAATGRVVRTLYEDRGRYFAAGGMAFSSKGQLLTSVFDVWPPGPLGDRPGSVGNPSGNSIRKALAWNVATGQEIPLPRIGSGDCIVPSPDGKTLAIAIQRFDSDEIIIFDSNTGRTVRTLKVGDRYRGGCKVAFSQDGRLLAGLVHRVLSVAEFADKSIRSWHEVKLWDVETGNIVHTLRDHPRDAEVMAFGGKWLALACEGGSTQTAAGTGPVYLYKVDTGKLAYTLQGHVRKVTAMAFAPDGQTLATTSRDDGTLKLWDITDGLAYPGPLTFETGSLSPDGQLLEGGGLLLYWSLLWGSSPGIAGKVLPRDHPAGRAVLQDVAFSRDGSRLAAAYLAYVPGGIEAHRTEVRAEVMVWDVSPPRVIRTFRRTFRASEESVERVALSPDGSLLVGHVARRDPVSREKQSDLILWDVNEDKLVNRRRGQADGAIGALAFCPDGKRVAFTTSAKNTGDITLPELGTIAFWDMGSNKVVRTLIGHDLPVGALAFPAGGGRTLVSGSSDGTVKRWDLDSGVSVNTLRGPHPITSIALHPGGRRLAVGTTYGTVQVWSVDTGEELLTLESRDRRAVENLSFSKAGNRLVSLSSEGTVKVWDANPLSLQRSTDENTARAR